MKAFTLTECLTIMIVGGIVFLGVTEGFGLLSAHITEKSLVLDREQLIYSDLRILSEVVAEYDSILSGDGKIEIYLAGRQTNLFSKEGKLLIGRENFTDTLLKGYKTTLTFAIDLDDSVKLPLIGLQVDLGNDKHLDYTFRPRLSVMQELKSNIEEAEGEYIYD